MLSQRMTSPVKMENGGDFWGDISGFLSGTPKVAPIATIASPISADAPNPNKGPLDINPYPEPKAPPTSSGTFNLTGASKGIGAITDSLAPFASNIVNGLRTPPQPHSPQLDNMVTLRAPNYDNDRADVERNINASNAAIDRTVDGQTGAKIRLFNEGQKLERLSSVNQPEHNAQIETSNNAARINSGIMSRNTDRLNQYGDEKVERQIAQQREQSANISNASDKYVGIQNEKRKAQVDLEKTQTLANIFTNSGVKDRLRKTMKDQGLPDPMGKDYKDLDSKAFGGALGGRNSYRSFYRGIQPRAQTLKSLYKPVN